MPSDPNQPMMDGGGCALHEPFALQVLGPDMEPEFPDKCIVIIEPTEYCRNGMYVFVEVEGVRWFRQYLRDEQGRERLVAMNEIFPDIELNGLEWKVLGVIIQRNIRRKIKHYEYADGPSNQPQSGVQAIDITAS
ncbi:MAG: S24 family peptidase [Thiohalocapsa sp.]|jgi:SOS-response transcriptional repressor LexA|uniref:S24 family peptidase n=1 Tax=Thiohalocapsa sp. TaxID=2497641 RepID=UPI0025CBBFD7|nr:S24 family peptidase [Thiohalocapsa sp.]MCG6940447.1 S24 family peptidase [Thiohalocapsa sp.]